MSEQTILDLDAMLDIEMDKVETLPDYVTPPPGIYLLKVEEAAVKEYTIKAKDNKPAGKGNRLNITYSVVKTIETTDLPVKDGSLFSESFMATEDGIKFFKKQAMNIMNVTDLTGARMKDVLDGLKDIEFKSKITIRKTPDGSGGHYENVQVRPVHEATE